MRDTYVKIATFIKGVAMVAVFVVGLCALTPTAAHAQEFCAPQNSVTTHFVNYDLGYGTTIQADAETYTRDWDHLWCWTGYWRTELWFVGIPNIPQCSVYSGYSNTGGYSNGACVAISSNTQSPGTGGMAGTMADVGPRYGCAGAHSRHWNVSGTYWTWVGEYGGQACAGPPPAPEPYFCSGDYEWDDYQGTYVCLSPIMLPTAKHALKKRKEDYDLTDVKNGVAFDLDADGIQDYVAWTAANSDLGFLAFDRNGNGKIDDGKELFGNFTHPGKPNGFEALMVDGGRVGTVEEGNPLYDKLLLWTDRNHNGLSEPDELQPFKELYSSIDQSYEMSKLRDKHGNAFLYQGYATMRTAPGKNRQQTPQERDERLVAVYDVFLRVQR